MLNDQSTNLAYEELRQLAAQNPRAARRRFEELLDAPGDAIDGLLLRMAAPGEGRLRQLVANIARTRSDRERFKQHFSRWVENETDEFAKRAVLAAIEIPDSGPLSSHLDSNLSRMNLSKCIATYPSVCVMSCRIR